MTSTLPECYVEVRHCTYFFICWHNLPGPIRVSLSHRVYICVQTILLLLLLLLFLLPLPSPFLLFSQIPSSSSVDGATQPLSYPCSLQACKRREKVEIRCPYCQKVFCLQHRHQPDHSCIELIAKPVATVNKGKSSSTAATVARVHNVDGGETSRAEGSQCDSPKCKGAIFAVWFIIERM